MGANCCSSRSRSMCDIAPSVQSSDSACALRIVHVTDIYVLDNFPHLRNLIKDKRAEQEARCGGKTVSALTGDFLAPYLLSSMDNGVGMMAMLNGTPIDYLTWGNHEADLPHASVLKREKEYQGCWVNTNMQSHESFKDSKCQVASKIIEVVSRDGSNKRKIGLIAVLTNSPTIYKRNAFGGAKIEDPWETLRIYKAKLEAQGCDIVVPLCHLYEPDDERTCQEFDFPLVLGGHDHHVVDRVVNGTRLIKPGLDAHKAMVVDMVWHFKDAPRRPEVSAECCDVANWPADAELAAVAERAVAVLEPLKNTQLAEVSENCRPLTSFGSRERRVSMGTFLLSQIRDALNMHDTPGSEQTCDCAIYKGANIRGGRDYKAGEQITLEVLNSELEEKHEVVVVMVPGEVLRVGLRETWAEPGPGWMQFDDGMDTDEDGFVTHVNGRALDPGHLYHVATLRDFWRKSDAPAIGAYFEQFPDRMACEDAGVPQHTLLMQLFAVQIWHGIWNALDKGHRGELSREEFQRLGLDGDGKLTTDALKAAIANIMGFSTSDNQDIVVEKMVGEISKFQARKTARVSFATMNRAYRAHSDSM